MGNSKGRFEVSNEDTLVDLIPTPTTHTVQVTDKATGESAKGCSTTREDAERVAWDNLSKK